MLQVEGALVAGHAVEQNFQHSTQNALLGLSDRHRLRRKGSNGCLRMGKLDLSSILTLRVLGFRSTQKHFLPLAHLNDDLQRVEDDDVGLCGEVAVDKCFVLQFSSGPSIK